MSETTVFYACSMSKTAVLATNLLFQLLIVVLATLPPQDSACLGMNIPLGISLFPFSSLLRLFPYQCWTVLMLSQYMILYWQRKVQSLLDATIVTASSQSTECSAVEVGVWIGFCCMYIELLMMFITLNTIPSCHSLGRPGFKGTAVFPASRVHTKYYVDCQYV